jgi:hypothetical protein
VKHGARLRLAFASLSLALAGCPKPVTQPAIPADSRPLAQPMNINRPGPLVHAGTGLEFGERYEHFERVSAMQFDTAGLNVGVGYNDRRPECLIVSTFYLYPTPRMGIVGAAPEVVASLERDWLERGFAQSRGDVLQAHPRLESPVQGRVTTAADGETLEGKSYAYREADKLSELRLFVFRHQWFLKYRFTYTAACRGDAEARLAELVGLMPWSAGR